MAYDFPASPTIGQEFTSGAVTYVWNGTGWAIKGGSATDFVMKTGDTMTGNLTVNNNGPTIFLDKLAPDGGSFITGMKAGKRRFNMALGDGAIESGANVGSDFRLNRFDDAGVYIDSPIVVSRQTGLLSVSGVSPAPPSALANEVLTYNGSFEISQEYGFDAPVAVGGGIQFCDNWHAFTSLPTGVANMVCSTTGAAQFGPLFTNCGIINVTTPQAVIGAAERLQFNSVIEGTRLSKLGWGTPSAQPITLSFWTNHSKAGLYSGSIRNVALDRSYVFSYTQAAANVPQFNSVIIPGCTDGVWLKDNTRAAWLVLAIAAGSTFLAPSAGVWHNANYIALPGQVNAADAANSFRITGITITPGALVLTATQARLLLRTYSEELMICQRYYSKIIGGAANVYMRFAVCAAYSATGARTSPIFHPVEMRSNPTLVKFGNMILENSGSFLITSVANALGSTRLTHMDLAVASGLVAGQAYDMCAFNDATAYISLDARA
jgi:hypothetical protein